MPPPLVSVVIPTRGRPGLLGRAVDSVLKQTFRDFEVVVVLDGEDAEAETVLRQFEDPRLRWIVQKEPHGLPHVRTLGIDEAKGRWVAFLDDDDEWLPAKLAIQTELMTSAGSDTTVCFSRLIARSAKDDSIWPRRGPLEGEAISEYLFLRKDLFTGGSLIQPSTVLIPRRLLDEVPWGLDKTHNRHEDWDWYLRAAAHGARFLLAPEVLTVWHVEGGRPRVSTQADWRPSFDWIRGRRHLVTAPAYSSFMLVQVAGAAAVSRDWSAWPVLWKEAWRANGLPRVIDVVLFLGIGLFPAGTRERLRGLRSLLLRQRRHTPEGAAG